MTVADAWMLAGPASVAPDASFIATSTFFFAMFSLALAADLAVLSLAAANTAIILFLFFDLVAGLLGALHSDICDIMLLQNYSVTSTSDSMDTVLVLDSVKADSDSSSA